MNIKDFDYELEEKYIAQTPVHNRSESKLMILNKDNGNILHDRFLI